MLSDYFDPREKKWVELRKFVYADGTTDPPLPLRDTPDQVRQTEGSAAPSAKVAAWSVRLT